MAVISVVQRASLEGRRRIDAEYYQPKYIELANILSRCEVATISRLARSLKSFGAYSLMNQVIYREAGIPFLRGIDLEEGYADFSSVIFIDEQAHSLLWKSEVVPGQVLFAMSGSVGNAAVARPTWSYPVNSSQDLAKITLEDEVDPYYVATFLNSRYGRFQTERLPVGSIQQHVFLWQINTIKIPLFDALSPLVSKLSERAIADLEMSQSVYARAEQVFLSELGLQNWKPTPALTYTRNYSQVEQARRMDAEHFQPKYQELLARIPTSVRFDRLGRLTAYTKGVEVGSPAYTESGIPFWRVSNLTRHGLDDSNANFIRDEVYNDLRSSYEPQQGEILLSKDATPGLAYYLEQPIKGIVSSGILRLSLVDNIAPQYLELALNSLFVQLQIEQNVGGSIIKHWKPSEVRKTLIPRLSDEKEKEIAALIQKSHAARREAEALLEKTKRTIEIAIEEGEEQALEYIG